MAKIEELDHLLQTGNSGVLHHTETYAMNDRVQEWLETPEGTVADKPRWGNRLAFMKHEPPGIHLNVLAEMDIIEKLPRDITDLKVSGILVEFREIDQLWVGIVSSMGNFTGEVQL